MAICLAAFIILFIGILFWPLVRIFNQKSARHLASAFRAAVECIRKRTTFQKCEVRFEDRVKNLLLKKIILKRPNLVKPVVVLIYITSVIIILAPVTGIIFVILALAPESLNQPTPDNKLVTQQIP